MSNSNNDDYPAPKLDNTAPPPYTPYSGMQLPPINENISPKLPTYEEVQMEKILNDEPIPINTMPPPPIHSSMRVAPLQNDMFIAIENGGEEISSDDSLLGTDIVFVTAFFVSFLFNWIGFLMLTCFSTTIAGRYGALSGFGLSLAKWTLIVKKSTDFAHSSQNNWLWWLIMTFGFLICIRAILQYLSIKKTWRMLSTSAQQRLLFFY
ncbi:hypothetical protein PVAND_007379 [Polypedilum vanderplanki]|uniref:NEDD4 family-interacting protein 1-like protein n=1 Tax=Polypedilum vanderplanki TaxID=319348 RepID=A0A9J6C7M9_POLVA|nr:hypothetical protein PVAND_007379 [Polypedilum vanderplanki]